MPLFILGPLINLYGTIFKLYFISKNAERVPVRILLNNGYSSTPWRLDAYKNLIPSEGSRIRRSTTGEEERTVRITINGADVMLNLLLRPKKHHPVTKDTIVEWVAENGQRTISRGINTDHCWFIYSQLFAR